jgi:hypothetical protein
MPRLNGRWSRRYSPSSRKLQNRKLQHRKLQNRKLQ